MKKDLFSSTHGCSKWTCRLCVVIGLFLLLSQSGPCYSANIDNHGMALSTMDQQGSIGSASRSSSSSSSSSSSPSFTVEVHEGTDSEPVDEQTRLDTMLRAFQRLPEPELARLDVDDITSPVESGTERAERLKKAWTQRQAELKNAVDSMVKPAAFMADIAAKLRNSRYYVKQSGPGNADDANNDRNVEQRQVLSLLRELEALVDDVDNARDFHTIGGWPVLVELLESHHSPAVQAAAAWTIGTAVKNNYDYQLWLLESASSPSDQSESDKTNESGEFGVGQGSRASTAVELLVSLLQSSSHPHSRQRQQQRAKTSISTRTKSVDAVDDDIDEVDEMSVLQRKVLYALSSALRGNVDVQEAALAFNHTNSNINTNSATTSDISSNTAANISVDGVFVDYLARTVEAAVTSHPLNVRHNHFDRNNSIINDNHDYPDDGRDEEVPSPELSRKVWALVADMLEERRYIRHELLASLGVDTATTTAETGATLMSHSQQVVASLNLLGDRFCTESWAKRALRSLTLFGAQYRREVPMEEGGTGVGVDDTREEVVTMDGEPTTHPGQELQQGSDPGRAHKVALASLRASLSSILVVIHELLADKGQREAQGTDVIKEAEVELLLLTGLQGSANEGVAQRARDILTLL